MPSMYSTLYMHTVSVHVLSMACACGIGTYVRGRCLAMTCTRRVGTTGDRVHRLAD